MLIPKQDRVEDKKYRAWLSSLPCLACVREFDIELAPIYENDPAHIRTGELAGIARKPGDDNCVPLCRDHHTEQHNVGEKTFWGDGLEAAKGTAKALHMVYFPGNYQPAITVIEAYKELNK